MRPDLNTYTILLALCASKNSLAGNMDQLNILLYHLHIRLANKLHKINSGHEMPEYFLYICNAAQYLFDLTNKKTFWLWKNIQNVVKCHNLFQCNTFMLFDIHYPLRASIFFNLTLFCLPSVPSKTL